MNRPRALARRCMICPAVPDGAAQGWPARAAIASHKHRCRHARSGVGVPGLLAHVLVNKYADHLQLYRQSQIFGRDGPDIDRSTLADWVGKSTALLEPHADAIGRHVLAGQAIFADDTPVAMLAPGLREGGTGKTQTARLWACGRNGAHGAAPSHPPAGIASPATAKANTRRTICPDTPAGCRLTAMPGSRISTDPVISGEVDGMAHVRRKFARGHKAQVAPPVRLISSSARKFARGHKAQGPAIPDEAIRQIAELDAVEKVARGLPPDTRTAIRLAEIRLAEIRQAEIRLAEIRLAEIRLAEIRLAEAKPAFDSPEARLSAQLPDMSGKSPLASAIRYGLTRMTRMRPYLEHGILELGNNTAERDAGRRPGPQELPLCRITNRRQIRRHRLHPDRNRKTQRRRSPGLARRHPRPHP